ncbi:MAG: hypothetical protein ABI601_02950 [bacterium]
MGHRGLPDQLHGLRHLLKAKRELAPGPGNVDLIDDAGEKNEDDAAKDLVLLQDLMRIEPLLVSKRAELHRLRRDGYLCVELAYGLLDVVANSVDEHRNVVQRRAD